MVAKKSGAKKAKAAPRTNRETHDAVFDGAKALSNAGLDAAEEVAVAAGKLIKKHGPRVEKAASRFAEAVRSAAEKLKKDVEAAIDD